MLKKSAAPAGFTFLEILVAVAITAIIGATSYMTLSGRRDRERVDESYATLRALTRVIDAFDTATGNGTLTAGRHPQFLAQLNDSLQTITDPPCPRCRNLCNVAYTTGNRDGWNNRGPFFQSQQITSGVGFRIPIGLVRDALIRDPSATPADQGRTYGRLQIQIDDVDSADAWDLERLVDGVPSATAGVVRWSVAPVDGRYASIFWTLPLAGC